MPGGRWGPVGKSWAAGSQQGLQEAEWGHGRSALWAPRGQGAGVCGPKQVLIWDLLDE